MNPGVEQFMGAVTELGLLPTTKAELVVCRVTPLAGPYAGTVVEVGVAVDELRSWPQAPPYWVHLPRHVGFSNTRSSKPSTKGGWLCHSRQISGWGRYPPASGWHSHIQAVLRDATS